MLKHRGIARFSLRFILICTACIAALVSLVINWRTASAQFAMEEFLKVIWCVAFVISYVHPSTNPRQRIVRATLVTSVVWTACILLAYWSFAKTAETFGADFAKLLVRALMITAIGIAAAAFVACVLEVLRASWGIWSQARIIHISIVVALFALVGLIFFLRRMDKNGTWVPLIQTTEEAPLLPDEGIRNVRDRHIPPGLLFTSPGGRFVAQLNGPTIVVYDAITADIVTTLSAGGLRRFLSATFYPDGSALGAICYENNTTPILMKWDTNNWNSSEESDLNGHIGPSVTGEVFPILAEQCLLIVTINEKQSLKMKVEISIIDLMSDELTPHSIGTVTIDNFNTAQFSADIPLVWTVSPDRRCVVTPPRIVPDGSRLICTNRSTQPLLFRGDPLTFLCGGRVLAYYEYSLGLVWKSHRKQNVVSPPFWNHFSIETFHRVVLYDCHKYATLSQSEWWPCTAPYVNALGSRIAAQYEGRWVTWDINCPLQPARDASNE